MGISENLANLMKRRGENAYGLAERSKVPQPTINRILTGKHSDPRSTTVKKLADAYGLSESQLRGDMPISPEDQHGPPQQPGAAAEIVVSAPLSPAEAEERLGALETVLQAGAIQAGVPVDVIVGGVEEMRQRVRGILISSGGVERRGNLDIGMGQANDELDGAPNRRSTDAMRRKQG